MKKKAISITVFVLLLVGLFFGLRKTVHAQTPTVNITLTLSREETQYLINLLADRPYKESAGLINSIITQASIKPKVDTAFKMGTGATPQPKKKK